jgi:hypothetical protein
VNGFVYCFLRITDGVPTRLGWEIDSLFRADHLKEHWSWGNKGLKVEGKHHAEEIASEVFGLDYKGWVN